MMNIIEIIVDSKPNMKYYPEIGKYAEICDNWLKAQNMINNLQKCSITLDSG